MRYKRSYSPSELLDTANNKWYPIAQINGALDLGARHSFAEPACSVQPVPINQEEIALPRPLPPGVDDPEAMLNKGSECTILSVSSEKAVLEPIKVSILLRPCANLDFASDSSKNTWPYSGVFRSSGSTPGEYSGLTKKSG